MALTETQQALTILGNRRYLCMKITGDGSSATHTSTMAAVDVAWATAGTSTAGTTVTWSGSTVTFGTAIDSGSYVYLHMLGV